jgi:hypothetical protein
MKRLHRDDLLAYSSFDEVRDIDFNSIAWVRAAGNVLVDPLPMSAHDRAHLAKLGGAEWIVLTNSDHVRASAALAEELGAKIAGPRGEAAAFPVRCDAWLGDGDELVPGLVAFALDGSKTPGELALALDGTTLIFGDLVRGPRAGALALLPPEKLVSRALAIASLRRVADGRGDDAVLVGDGHCAFREGKALLEELLEREEDSVSGGRGREDSGQFNIPPSRTGIPVQRAGSACSFCGKRAAEEYLVSGVANAHVEPSAICAACAARLTFGATGARCDFCLQEAADVAAEKGNAICSDCLELARAVFRDGQV